MTTDPQSLIRILARLGMRLTANGKYLVCHRARGRMTDDLRQVIRARKAALMHTLKT